MSDDPYRELQNCCPACAGPLREYMTRLICDKCEGMMVSLADLSRALTEMTGIDAPGLEYVDEKPGSRKCPRCTAPMTTHKLRVVLGEEIAKPRPVLDRCSEHGIWFDGEELAAVFEKAHAKVSPRGSLGSWKGRHGVPEWWGGGHGGSY
jgi:ribosomal protein S27AE